jgi:hypothetical protein
MNLLDFSPKRVVNYLHKGHRCRIVCNVFEENNKTEWIIDDKLTNVNYCGKDCINLNFAKDYNSREIIWRGYWTISHEKVNPILKEFKVFL